MNQQGKTEPQSKRGKKIDKIDKPLAGLRKKERRLK